VQCIKFSGVEDERNAEKRQARFFSLPGASSIMKVRSPASVANPVRSIGWSFVRKNFFDSPAQKT